MADGGESLPFDQTGDPMGYRSLTIHIPAANGEMPVFRVRCAGEISVDPRIFDHGGEVSLYPLWARKYRRNPGEDVEVPMRVENNIHDSQNGRSGLAVGRAGIASGWLNRDEFLEWKVFLTGAGTYDIHLITLPGGHIGNPESGVTIGITKPGGDHQIVTVEILDESFRYRLSPTGADNVRIGLPCGRTTADRKGEYQIRLYRNRTGDVPLPAVCLRLKRMPCAPE